MPLGFWEDSDQLNLVAALLDPKGIGAVACTCRFARDNLCGGTALRWLAELRGLDPATTHIACLEHIELAEAMADLQTSIGFDRGSVEVRATAVPAIRRVVEMLRRHTALTLAIEAHCGLDAHAEFARIFSRRRALSVRRAMEQMAEELGAPGALSGRLITRAWGNSRPLVWLSGSENAGRVNARVELFLSHEGFEAPQRKPIGEYARSPCAEVPPVLPDAEAKEMERQAADDATFDGEEVDEDLDPMAALMGGQMVLVEVPDGRQVMLPLTVLQQLQQMDQADAMRRLEQILQEQAPMLPQGDSEEDDVVDDDDDEPEPEPEPADEGR